eukprot:CAMPEP_0185300668 /NCGR_PEP_ID=MMETSP1363-20130426/12188_1 /TAXON_ID=38817 /ORGANISM="Gephyrocapsa oceanica, Strain RCC1303" /LENGTH=48 /DNA_ID= /DNA_START= /DNA_END= /DNA_ORIENTATION=
MCSSDCAAFATALNAFRLASEPTAGMRSRSAPLIEEEQSLTEDAGALA